MYLVFLSEGETCSKGCCNYSKQSTLRYSSCCNPKSALERLVCHYTIKIHNNKVMYHMKLDVPESKEANVSKAKIVRLNKNILRKHVRTACMIKDSSHIRVTRSVNHVGGVLAK